VISTQSKETQLEQTPQAASIERSYASENYTKVHCHSQNTSAHAVAGAIFSFDNGWEQRQMRNGITIVLVWIAAIAFFNTIIGVFGIQAALAGLVLFVALACVLTARAQRREERP
jgi:hypothetical protein